MSKTDCFRDPDLIKDPHSFSDFSEACEQYRKPLCFYCRSHECGEGGKFTGTDKESEK